MSTLEEKETVGKQSLNRKIDLFLIDRIDWMYKNGKISSKGELYEKMRISRHNYHRIKKGYAHFTLEHYYRLCEFLKLDANLIKKVK